MVTLLNSVPTTLLPSVISPGFVIFLIIHCCIGSSKATNTFFGLKDVVGAGDCGFLCLMVAINSDENVSRWFDNAVQEFNKKVGNNVKKTQSSLPIT